MIVTEIADPEELWDDEDLQPLIPAGVTMQSYVEFDEDIVTSSTTSSCIEELLTLNQDEEETEEQEDEDEVPYVSRNETWNHVIGLTNYALRLVMSNCCPLTSTAETTWPSRL